MLKARNVDKDELWVVGRCGGIVIDNTRFEN